MPLVNLFRTSKRSKDKENVPQKKNAMNEKEPLPYISPYSVVTQPKMHTGPRSCPGAPMADIPMGSREHPFSDRHSHINSSARYENLPRRRNEATDDGNYRRPSSHLQQRPIREERSYYEPSYQYESCESDEDDIHDMQKQITELSREQRKLRDKCRDYRRRMDKACEDADFFKRTYERQEIANQQLRKKLDQEQQRRAIAEHKNERLSREYHLSNQKIMDLEEKLAFFERNLDKQEQNTGADGAGEALCDQNDAYSRDMVNSDTPSLSMFSDGNIDQEKDEVRIFHPQDSDEEELDEDVGTPEVEVERSMRASPVELAVTSSPPLYNFPSNKIGRSLSDTDIQSLTSGAEVLEQTKVVKTATLERTPMFRRRGNMPMGSCFDSSDISSTDEDEKELNFQQQQFQKQLKKKGEAVKYTGYRRKPAFQIRYDRCGKQERAAMEQLEFLDDMSTDVSGLLSSPDVVIPTARLYK